MLGLNKKDANVNEVVAEVIQNPKLLAEVMEGVVSEEVPLKFQCQKVLQVLSAQNPQLLYPYWDFFVDLLKNPNTFIKANTVNILGQLTSVDTEDKFAKIFPTFYGLMQKGSMITAGNIAKISEVIAKNKPQLREDIISYLVNIDKTHHSAECKNVIKGHAILTLQALYPAIEDKPTVISFVKKELKNSRSGTRRKAEAFLKRTTAK